MDSTHNALVAVTNGGTRPTDALLTVHYDNGKQKYEMQQTIEPGGQMWLNFADLIHQAVPDRKGRVLPSDLSEATYELEDLNPGLGGNLIEGKVSLDKTWGHLAYGCLTCCGDTPYLSPDPLGVGVGLDGFIGANGVNNCSGRTDSLSSYFSQTTAKWWSGNSATATVTSFNGHGVAIGSTNGFATADVPDGDGNFPKSPCPKLTQEGTNNIHVDLTISQIQPLWYFGGNPSPSGFTLGSTTVTLSASGGGSGAYSWTVTSGSSIVALQGATSGQNVTSVQVTSSSYSKQKNDVTVEVQFTPSGGASATASYSFSVDSPYKMLPNGVTDKGVNSCSDTTGGGVYGYKTQAIYTVQSFFGVTLSNVGVNEEFASVADDYIGNNWPIAIAGGLMLPSSGLFADTICVVDPGQNLTPRTLPPQNPLQTEMIDHSSQFWFVGSVTPASGVEVKSDTQQYYQDHGRHLNIVSPVR